MLPHRMTVARSRIAGCVAALLLTGAALGLRAAIGADAGTRLPMLPFVPAVIVAAWIGGLWAGLFASALALAASMYAIHTGVPGGLGDSVNVTRLSCKPPLSKCAWLS